MVLFFFLNTIIIRNCKDSFFGNSFPSFHFLTTFTLIVTIRRCFRVEQPGEGELQFDGVPVNQLRGDV